MLKYHSTVRVKSIQVRNTLINTSAENGGVQWQINHQFISTHGCLVCTSHNFLYSLDDSSIFSSEHDEEIEGFRYFNITTISFQPLNHLFRLPLG